MVLQLVRHRDRERFDILVAFLDEPADLVDAFSEAGAMPVCIGRHVRGPVRTIARLALLLREEQIDLLHVHSGPDRKYGHMAALVTATPVVGHLHSPWNHRGPFPPPGAGSARRSLAAAKAWARDGVERRAVRAYVSAGEEVRHFHLPFAHVPVTTVTNGIALEPFALDRATARQDVASRLGLAGDETVLISVGRLVPGKGHPAMLSMLKDVPGTLLLVGGGPDQAALEAHAVREGVSERVRFLGDRTDVAELLAASDVFVFASETEGLPMSVLEAMAAAIPVVSFALPALAAVVADGVTGYLVPVGDRHAWTARVRQLAGDPKAARVMGERGRVLVATRFDGRAMAARLDAVYEGVLALKDRTGKNGS